MHSKLTAGVPLTCENVLWGVRSGLWLEVWAWTNRLYRVSFPAKPLTAAQGYFAKTETNGWSTFGIARCKHKPGRDAGKNCQSASNSPTHREVCTKAAETLKDPTAIIKGVLRGPRLACDLNKKPSLLKFCFTRMNQRTSRSEHPVRDCVSMYPCIMRMCLPP